MIPPIECAVYMARELVLQMLLMMMLHLHARLNAMQIIPCDPLHARFYSNVSYRSGLMYTAAIIHLPDID
jgi:hypothetical protein